MRKARLAGNERGPAGGAGLLGVAVGEDRPLFGDAVDVGRAVAHHPSVVGTDVPESNIIPPDDEDVRLLAGLLGLGDDVLVVSSKGDKVAFVHTFVTTRRLIRWSRRRAGRSGGRISRQCGIEIARCRRVAEQSPDRHQGDETATDVSKHSELLFIVGYMPGHRL